MSGENPMSGSGSAGLASSMLFSLSVSVSATPASASIVRRLDSSCWTFPAGRNGLGQPESNFKNRVTAS